VPAFSKTTGIDVITDFAANAEAGRDDRYSAASQIFCQLRQWDV
jgi:hypothetical protein